MLRKRNIQADKSGLPEHDTLENAPLLKGIGKRNPFTVPDGYFEGLPSQIMAQCTKGQQHIPSAGYNKILLLFKPQYIFVSFLAIVSIALFLRHNYNYQTQNYQSLAVSISDSALLTGVQNDIAYTDISDLENMMANQNTPLFEELPESPPADSANGQIINYLINNNVDASDIESNL